MKYQKKLIAGLLIVCFLALSDTASWGKHAEYTAKPEDVQKGYFLFTKPVFELVLPSYRPRVSEIITDKVSGWASAGEYEPVTFFIRALKDLKEVKVSTTELKCGNRIIPADKIDVRIVKCWPQADPGTGKPRLVPELLVKDDRLQMKGWLSSMPLTPFAITDIPKDQSRQVWITVKIPADQKPGIYRGVIHIQSPGIPAGAIPLEFEVLPIRLLGPAKTYSIYYTHSSFGLASWPEYSRDGKINDEWVRQSRLQLKDIREHGFDSAGTLATLTGSTASGKLVLDFTNLKQSITLHREAGLTGPTFYEMGYSLIDGKAVLDIRSYPKTSEGRKQLYDIYQKVVEQTEQFCRKEFGKEFRLYYYGIDEANKDPNRPSFDDPALAPNYSVEVCRRLFEAAHQGGGLTACALYRSVDYGGIDLLGPLADLPIYNYGSVFPGQKPEDLRAEAKTKKGVWTYWQCWMEDPKENRLMAGLILWKSGFTGIAPYVYNGTNSPDPYQDSLPNYGKNMSIVYPSREGPIPTLAWEALREGVDDVRYITTLAAAINQAKDPAKAQRAAKVLNEVLAKISLNESEALFEISEADLQTFRQKIAQAIMEVTK